MTKKDYIAIADVLQMCNNSPHEFDCIENIVSKLCYIFKLENPKFKETKFKEACGV